uniref:Uncharacterized protein n=1 Tax=uncultured prokaryote TaxID=198431 RepID=A0A0H5Q2Y2_9ZZZZ|nr:hypothetical protein [uncultured prokaryote]
MENSLSPAFVKIEYTSAYAPHVMTVPSVPLIAAVGDAAPYFDLRGAEIDVSVVTAITDYVSVLKELFLASTVFNSATVFSQPSVGDAPVPVWSFPLGIVGTNGAATLSNKAVQATYSFRATDFTIFKAVLLDVPVGAANDKVTAWPDGSIQDNLVEYITAPETWIASRGGGRPNVFLQTAFTLNEKLRRSYRMN